MLMLALHLPGGQNFDRPQSSSSRKKIASYSAENGENIK